MPAVSSTAPSRDPYIDGLLSESKWAVSNLTYSFPESSSFYERPYGAGEPSNNFEPLNALEQTTVRTALTMFASLANLSFTELVESGTQHADLRFAESDSPATARGYYPSYYPSGGDAWFNKSSGDYDNPVKGNYAYISFVHEAAHTLGLDHPQDGMVMPTDRDSMEYTVMSYRSYVNAPLTGHYTNGPWGYAQSPMMYDIAALQYLYGANYTTNSGDTTYSWNPATGETFINGVGQGTPGADKIFLTIWDGGGTDTYDCSNYASGVSIDLHPGAWTTTSAAQLAHLTVDGSVLAAGNIANALLTNGDVRSLIENAIGGAGDDTIFGNQADNKLYGWGGNDVLAGGEGNDTLAGGPGNDRLYGDAGNDLLLGEAADDLLVGGPGNDILGGGPGNDILGGDDGDDFLDGNEGDDKLYGHAGNDRLIGGSGHDVLAGSIGDDVLAGGADADELYGDAGNDQLFGDAGNDFIVGGPGVDTLSGGEADDTLGGGDDADFLEGDAGQDRLYGEGGDDRLLGGPGNDLLAGGDGNDILAGGDADDELHGETGNDQLFGDAGLDRLDGGAGDDQLVGGLGSDTFVFAPGFGHDIIFDFHAGAGSEDVIAFDRSVFSGFQAVMASSQQVGGDVVISADAADTVTLLNVRVGTLHSDDFAFL